MLTALVVFGMTAVSSFLYFVHLPPNPSRLNSRNHQLIIFWFSCMILVVIGIAILSYLTHAWEDLFRVHIGISFLLGLSGLAVGNSNYYNHRLYPILAKLYVITASISWYGVMYSFIIAEEVIRWHHYLRPGLFLAFLTYGGAMITSSWIFSHQTSIELFLIYIIGLLSLLSYFWIVERYFIDYLNHSYFIGSVMHTMPIRLNQITTSTSISQTTPTAVNDRTVGDMEFFSNHRISYSMLLCACHVLSYVLTCLLGMKPTFSTSGQEEAEEDESNLDISNQPQQQQQQQDKIDHHRLETKYSDTKSLRETLRHRKMATAKKGSAYEGITNGVANDSIEISYEEAATLSQQQILEISGHKQIMDSPRKVSTRILEP